VRGGSIPPSPFNKPRGSKVRKEKTMDKRTMWNTIGIVACVVVLVALVAVLLWNVGIIKF